MLPVKAIVTIAAHVRTRLWVRLIYLSLPLCVVLAGCTEGERVVLGKYDYPHNISRNDCQPDERTGQAGATDGDKTVKGIKYNVRTPANYDHRVAHPLLVVYPPAGRSQAETERMTGLTEPATRAGFVVAYAEHRRTSIPLIIELSTIPNRIAEKWCIDKQRIYLTGHSDGGTVALAMAILDQTKQIPAGIALSAAGFTGADLAEYACPAPVPVMIMHSANDSLFPGFGSEVAAWWAACNKCAPSPTESMANGCTAYPHCADCVATLYCEGAEQHARWPGLNDAVIDFFRSAGGS